MKPRRIFFAIVTLTLMFPVLRTHSAMSPQGDKVCLREFVIPEYPILARQAGIQAQVDVEIELDPKCAVSGVRVVKGHALLDETVVRSVRLWHFASCGHEPEMVKASFNFLPKDGESDDPTGDWAPTHSEMSAPYTFEIRTSVPYIGIVSSTKTGSAILQ